VAINDTLPFKAVRRDAFPSYSLLGFEFELQTNSTPFHLDSL